MAIWDIQLIKIKLTESQIIITHQRRPNPCQECNDIEVVRNSRHFTAGAITR